MTTQSQVRVAGTGVVAVAPKETVAPTGLATLADPWVELGYVTTDGVTFTISRESTDLNAWQGDKIRVLTTAEPMTVEFSLMETSPAVLTAALGGGTVETATGVSTITPPAKGTNTERALVVDFTDGEGVDAINYRYYMPRVQIEGDVSWQLQRADSLNYGLTFGVLDADPKYLILTDDPAFEDTGGLLLAPTSSETEDEPVLEDA